MFIPGIQSAPISLRNIYGMFLLIRVRAEDCLSEIAEAVQALQDRLSEAIDGSVMANADRDVAYHRRRHAAKVYRAERRALALTILGRCDNNHRARPYVRLFPKGYGQVRRRFIQQLIDGGHILLAGLATETDPEICAHTPRIADTLEGLEAAHAEYDHKRIAASRSAVDLKEAKAAWLEQYAGIYHRLFEVFPGNRALVETYFRPRKQHLSEEYDETSGDGDEIEEPEPDSGIEEVELEGAGAAARGTPEGARSEGDGIGASESGNGAGEVPVVVTEANAS